jgi:GntR family transcriptional regulator
MDEINNYSRKRKRLYTYAIESIQESISRGRFKPGDRLPREEDLANEIGVSRSTLREAMGFLETHGIISRRQGIGSFVTVPENSDFLGGLDRLQSLQSLAKSAELETKIKFRELNLIKADKKIASFLALESGSEIIRFQIVQAVKEHIAAYMDAYIRPSIVDFGDLSASKGSFLDYLQKNMNCSPSYTHSEIFAINADENVARMLEVSPGKAILHLSETYFSKDGNAISHSLNYFVSEIFHFYVLRRIVTAC